MQILKNKGIKKLLISFSVIILVSFALLFWINNQQNQLEKEKINIVISRMVNNIKKAYPNVEDEELIKILNQKDLTGEDDLLLKYGLDKNDNYIIALKKIQTNRILYNACILGATIVLLVVIVYIYLKYRQKEIEKLTQYVESILNKSYDLAIAENSEDELNGLKNELYKITVMLKEEAKNSNIQKEALATSVSDISHQLKTPLTSILILLDNLSQSENMDKETREKFIEEIARQIEGMNWLVISLLKLSKLDTGVVEFSNTKVNVSDLIEDCLANLEILAELKNVSFEVKRATQKQIYFQGDYNWNKEAIQNIIKNAVEHTKENTVVTITIEENDVYTAISVKDRGEGIKPKDIKHIFDRFYKAENASDNSFGIGLSLSKSIIEKQNGYIEVKIKDGEGTTFKVKYIK